MGDRFFSVADHWRSTSSCIQELGARKSDCLETSWEVSLCHTLHFDPAYACEILHSKNVDPSVTYFLALPTDGDPCRRPSNIWLRGSRIALKLLGRPTWSTAGRPTRITFKLLGKLPCVIGIILSEHMHVRFGIEKKWTHDSLIFHGQIHVVDRRATDSDRLETSWEASLCRRDHLI
ncbi:uncharacterized protein G2W53_026920 [Senna tora]|uniref:Uncharacterized protein n=1 Tax=Senna tora TaxID=362788 RepID=A0A834WFJ5_9FABA|nr:uncharacterized protein G2W53_026920 [Senna tora]